MNQNCSEAYQWIDANTDYMLETPDDAFDWVYMLNDTDWELLASTWESRSPFAREALAYIVCEGPHLESRPMLLLALKDPDKNVAGQAAESIRSQFELFGAECLPLDVESQQLLDVFSDHHDRGFF